MSGSFCVSITAAIGIPKLDAGPQKSAQVTRMLVISSEVIRVGIGREGDGTS